MTINVDEGWARRDEAFPGESRKYDIVLVRYQNSTDVWATRGKKEIIYKIPGVAYVGVSEEIPNYYEVQFDPRYDRLVVEEQIMTALMDDLENDDKFDKAVKK